MYLSRCPLITGFTVGKGINIVALPCLLINIWCTSLETYIFVSLNSGAFLSRCPSSHVLLLLNYYKHCLLFIWYVIGILHIFCHSLYSGFFYFSGGLKIPVKHMFHEDLYPNLRFCETLRQIDALNPDMLMKEPHYSSAVAKIQSKIGQLKL